MFGGCFGNLFLFKHINQITNSISANISCSHLIMLYNISQFLSLLGLVECVGLKMWGSEFFLDFGNSC